MEKVFRNIIALLFLLVVFSCSDDNTNPKKVLVGSTKVLSRSSSELKTFINASGLGLDASQIKYDADIYKVTYTTRYQGNDIEASGLIILPKTNESVDMLSFQHGTIVAQSDAPSASPLNSSTLVLYAALAGSGFIVVVPDYIGFGSSSSIFHPYYVEEVTASSVIDNLKAAKDLATEKGISFNQKLFLAGYSQGGYATMATHKAIEEDGLEGFNLIASFPASGGYDVKKMQEYFFSQSVYDQPHYIAYVAMSYKSYYGWTTDLSQMFKEPYAAKIPALFNATNTSTNINDQLTNNIVDLLQPDILSNINSDAKFKYLVDAFHENSLVDWSPKAKMFMYHGDADTTVPYQNSVSSYNALLANGASAETLKFIALPGANHGSGVVPYIRDFIDKLTALK